MLRDYPRDSAFHTIKRASICFATVAPIANTKAGSFAKLISLKKKRKKKNLFFLINSTKGGDQVLGKGTKEKSDE